MPVLFDRDLRHCEVTYNGVDYGRIRVKRIRDIPRGSALFLVRIPLEKPIIVAYGYEAAMERRRDK